MARRPNVKDEARHRPVVPYIFLARINDPSSYVFPALMGAGISVAGIARPRSHSNWHFDKHDFVSIVKAGVLCIASARAASLRCVSLGSEAIGALHSVENGFVRSCRNQGEGEGRPARAISRAR